jgi:hypothetical protein
VGELDCLSCFGISQIDDLGESNIPARAEYSAIAKCLGGKMFSPQLTRAGFEKLAVVADDWRFAFFKQVQSGRLKCQRPWDVGSSNLIFPRDGEKDFTCITRRSHN